jgi:thiamine kinase-like enzyme
MKKTGNPTNPVEHSVEDALSSFKHLKGRPLQYEPAYPPIAMPMHLAIDADAFIVAAKDPDETCFLKVYSKDMLEDINLATAIHAGQQAGDCNLAPMVLDSSVETGAILFELLDSNWRPALASDLDDKDIRANAIAAKRLWHENAQFGDIACTSPMQVARKFMQRLEQGASDGNPIKKPNGYATMVDWIKRIDDALSAAEIPEVALHGENAASNIMIGSDKTVKLVDFDRVCSGDPMYDLGAFCLEFCQFDHQLIEAVEMYHGSFDEKLFNRCKLFMIVDDFLWGCWGKTSHYTSFRSEAIEFYKYGEVRFTRCLHNIITWDMDTTARRI